MNLLQTKKACSDKILRMVSRLLQFPPLKNWRPRLNVVAHNTRERRWKSATTPEIIEEVLDMHLNYIYIFLILEYVKTIRRLHLAEGVQHEKVCAK